VRIKAWLGPQNIMNIPLYIHAHPIGSVYLKNPPYLSNRKLG
jgi:hypothetical protein